MSTQDTHVPTLYKNNFDQYVSLNIVDGNVSLGYVRNQGGGEDDGHGGITPFDIAEFPHNLPMSIDNLNLSIRINLTESATSLSLQICLGISNNDQLVFSSQGSYIQFKDFLLQHYQIELPETSMLFATVEA